MKISDEHFYFYYTSRKFLRLFKLILGTLFCFYCLSSAANEKNENHQSCPAINLQFAIDLESHLQNFRLDNGLHVLLQPMPNAKTVSVNVTYNIGSGDESNLQYGYAHLLEHLMFSGTENIPDGLYNQLIRQSGGWTHASTDYDKTSYYQQIPAENLEQVLWIEADRMTGLALTMQAIFAQKNAVLEEKAMRIDNYPYVAVLFDLFSNLASGSRYDHTIIGNQQTISKASEKSLLDLYHRFYQPDNATLTITGNFAVDEARPLIRKYFQSTIIYNDTQIAEKKSSSINLKEIEDRVKNERGLLSLYDPKATFPLFFFALVTNGLNDKDALSLDLIFDILMRGDSSRLKEYFYQNEDLAFESLSFPVAFENAGMLNMAFVPRTFVDLDEIRYLISKEIENIVEFGISQEEFCFFIKKRQIDILETIQNPVSVSVLINEQILQRRKIHWYARLVELNQLTRESIQLVAKQRVHNKWIVVEVKPDWYINLFKWLMESMPRSWAQGLENAFL